VKINEIGVGSNTISLNSKVIPTNQQQAFTGSTVAGSLSQPYWLASPHKIGTYTIADTAAGNPENPDLAKVNFQFIIEGKPVNFERRMVYKYVDPVRGEVYQPLEITPPVTANITSHVFISYGPTPQSLQVNLKSFTKVSTGEIRLKLPAGWKATPEAVQITNKNKGDEWTERFTITPSANAQNGIAETAVTVNGDKQVYSDEIREIKYDHVPNIALFPPSQAKLVSLDLKTGGKKLGYIAGAGDLMPEALRQVGYEVHMLSESEIMNTDLSTYDAIITGVRAYNVNERLAYEQPKLMEYVKNGGNLVVQYNNNSGLVTKQIGPYPFTVVNRRVTDEDATVTVLDAQNAVLTYPNKIDQNDFKGWIQERGLYFVGDFDPHIKPFSR
jgi:hypothetical protein